MQKMTPNQPKCSLYSVVSGVLALVSEKKITFSIVKTSAIGGKILGKLLSSSLVPQCSTSMLISMLEQAN